MLTPDAKSWDFSNKRSESHIPGLSAGQTGCACALTGCITLRESERDFYVATIATCPCKVKREKMLIWFTLGFQEYRVKCNDGRFVYTIRDYKTREGRRRGTSLKKRNSHSFNLHRDYSCSLTLSNVGELSPPSPPPPKKKHPEKDRQFR